MATTAKGKALEKKSALEADRERQRELQEEQRIAKEWAVGAKDSAKLKAVEDKDMEKQRKAAEKAALLAAEEAETSGIKKVDFVLL